MTQNTEPKHDLIGKVVRGWPILECRDCLKTVSIDSVSLALTWGQPSLSEILVESCPGVQE